MSLSQADGSVPQGRARDIYRRSRRLSAGAVPEPASVVVTYLRSPTVEPGAVLARKAAQAPAASRSQPTTFVLPVANSEPPPPQRPQDAPSVAAWQAELNVRVYQLNSEGAADETEGDVTSCQIWMLPATVLVCSTHACFKHVHASCALSRMVFDGICTSTRPPAHACAAGVSRAVGLSGVRRGSKKPPLGLRSICDVFCRQVRAHCRACPSLCLPGD